MFLSDFFSRMDFVLFDLKLVKNKAYKIALIKSCNFFLFHLVSTTNNEENEFPVVIKEEIRNETRGIEKEDPEVKEEVQEVKDDGDKNIEKRLTHKKARHTGWHVLMHEHLVSFSYHKNRI